MGWDEMDGKMARWVPGWPNGWHSWMDGMDGWMGICKVG